MENENGLYWVSVGGNECEPARLEDGKVFTIGCNDGTVIEEGCGIEIVGELRGKLRTPKEQARLKVLWEEKRKREREAGIRHRYRRFKK